MSQPFADPAAAASPSLSFITYTTASSIYDAVYQHLTRTQAQEINTHIILSHILKLCKFERPSPLSQSLLPSSPISTTSGTELSASPLPLFPENLWITAWSGPPHSRTLRFVVSLTQDQTGHHPLFIVDLAPGTMNPSSLRQAMSQVAAFLAQQIPGAQERVYAVFGPRSLVQGLSTAWSLQTDMMLLEETNLAARYMECTRLSPQPSSIAGHRIRRAGSNDIELAIELCRSYSSPPCSLDLENARQEANTLIADGGLFLYEVDNGTGDYCVACVLGIGRSSINVASITKLYTLPNFTKRGYATRLLHHVCTRLLGEGGKCAVVAYVPYGDVAYERVVTQVGFGMTSSGYEDWLELGFEGQEPGHW